MNLLRRVVLSLSFGLMWLIGAPSWALVLQVSPQGSDVMAARGGVAFRTVEAALLTARKTAPAGEDVVLRFEAGDYGDQALVVDWMPAAGARLVLDGGSPTSRARFDGRGTARTWLVVKGEAGKPARIVIRHFHVLNYRGAVAFGAAGDEDGADEARASHSRIEGNVFENIGQFDLKLKPAFAAIALTASRDNEIVGNTFRNVRNLERCDGLHVLYLARGASGNRITGNTFDGSCGDTIKVRDGSNDNTISGNRFLNQTGKSLFVDSFCDKVRLAECKSTRHECPSWRNRFVDNEIDDVSRRAVKAITRTVGRSKVERCPLPGPKDERIADGGR